MDENGKIIWSAPEYEDKERSKDWFWALGIIVATSAVAAIIFNDYFFAAILVLGGVMLGFFSVRKPKDISYELNERGLRISNIAYPYETIKSFWVQSEASSENAKTKPLLFVHTSRIFMPVIVIPIESHLANDIREVMLFKQITEIEMRETASEKIMEALGF